MACLTALLWGITLVGAASADRQDDYTQTTNISDPEFIVIVEMPPSDISKPTLNIRLVIHARGEGDAIWRTSVYLQQQFGSNLDIGRLKFIEAAPRRKDGDK